jgi:hypothetical protein
VTCSLTLRGEEAQFRLDWSAGMPVRAIVERRDWQFQPGNVLDIVVRIGDVPLGRGSGAPTVPAMTGQSTLMFVARDDIGALLRQARDIRVDAGSGQADIAVTPGKMNSLMNALDRCKAFTTGRR